MSDLYTSQPLGLNYILCSKTRSRLSQILDCITCCFLDPCWVQEVKDSPLLCCLSPLLFLWHSFSLISLLTLRNELYASDNVHFIGRLSLSICVCLWTSCGFSLMLRIAMCSVTLHLTSPTWRGHILTLDMNWSVMQVVALPGTKDSEFHTLNPVLPFMSLAMY